MLILFDLFGFFSSKFKLPKILEMFKKRAGVFYRGEAQPSGFRPDKTRAASFLNGFKNIPGKACVNGIHNNYAFANVGNERTRY